MSNIFRWKMSQTATRIVTAGLLLILGTNGSSAAAPPNIVIILADDMGYGDPGCYNPESKIPTPNIDRLARQGVRFTDAHAPAGWCTPSRYGLLTGRYPWRSPRQLDGGVIEPKRMTLASLLAQHGYQTACIGKWHLGFEYSAVERDFSTPFLGGPRSHGFQHFFGMHASLDIPPYYWIENEACLQPPTQSIDDHHSPDVTPIQGAFWRGGKIAPDFAHDKVLDELLARAVEFLRRQRDSTVEEPFFLYLPLTGPHTPWLPKALYRNVSQAGDYGDFTAQVDALLGTVLQTLDELDFAQQTIVIFSSDNGPVWYPQDVARFAHRSTGPLRGMKIDLWEGAHRVPMVVRWPGVVPARSVCDQLVCFTDWMATFAAILGVSLPDDAGEDSLNILPLLKGERTNGPIRETLVIEGRMIRLGPWKLVRGNPNGGLARFAEPRAQPPQSEVVLYKLDDDLGETTDLSDRHPEMVRQLQSLLTAEQAQ